MSSPVKDHKYGTMPMQSYQKQSPREEIEWTLSSTWPSKLPPRTVQHLKEPLQTSGEVDKGRWCCSFYLCTLYTSEEGHGFFSSSSVASELVHLFSSSSRANLVSPQMSELFAVKAGIPVVEVQFCDLSSFYLLFVFKESNKNLIHN